MRRIFIWTLYVIKYNSKHLIIIIYNNKKLKIIELESN